MDYGSDLYLDDNRDVVFTPDGDIETTSGAKLVAQDVREELSIYLGSVLWDREAGSNITNHLNAINVDDITILNELERVTRKDSRVDATTIEVAKKKTGVYSVSFCVVGSTDTQTLLFDLDSLMGGNNAD